MPSLPYHVCGCGRQGTRRGGMPSLPCQLLCAAVPWTTPGESSGTEEPGSRTVWWYSRAQRQTTTEIWLPLQFCSFIIAHGSSPSLPETVCAEPIVCCIMIGRNPSHGSRVCTVGCAAIERQSTSLTSHPCTCSWIGFICAKCLESAHNPLNMVNEPGKMPNLNMVICRVYVRRRKKNSRAKNEENLD